MFAAVADFDGTQMLTVNITAFYYASLINLMACWEFTIWIFIYAKMLNSIMRLKTVCIVHWMQWR